MTREIIITVLAVLSGLVEVAARNSAAASTVSKSIVPEVLKVGSEKRYKSVSDALNAAHDGCIIEIDSGTYIDEYFTVKQNNITLKGVGGCAHFHSTADAISNRKGILLQRGDNLTVEWLEFSGAKVKDRNGSGIRDDGGTNLTVRHCVFHDNENGILMGANEDSRILIEYSHFSLNGYGDGQSHNLYVGKIGYGIEQNWNPSRNLYLVNNTIVNDFPSGNFINVDPGTAVFESINNIFPGAGTVYRGKCPTREAHNLTETFDPGFSNRAAYEYALKRSADGAVDRGINPGSTSNFNLLPLYQYVHPAGLMPRPLEGTIDIGAYELKEQ